jgi:leader peptidase (prepilin peptidase)/N-methyltransferase
MDLGVGVVAGVVALPVGAFTIGFAVAVPSEGPLPRPSLSMLTFRGRAPVMVVGAALVALVSAILGGLLGASILMPAYWLCGILAVVLAIVDIRRGRLPFAITGVMYVVSAVVFVADALVGRDATELVRAGIGAVVVLVAFLALALALPGQLGLGDVVLLGWVAFSLAWFGWRIAVVGLLAALIGQALVGAMVRLRSGAGRTLPLGPALLLGWLGGVVVAAV